MHNEEINLTEQYSKAKDMNLLKSILDGTASWFWIIPLLLAATTVEVESLFSFAGNIVIEHRTSLNPDMVENLLFLHEFIRKGNIK